MTENADVTPPTGRLAADWTDRSEPGLTADEREMLTGWLDYHRATLAMKCDGLTDDQLRQRAVPPSTLSLLGLVRHMAEVERGWFQMALAGKRLPGLYSSDADPDGEFDVATADVAEAFRTWREQCAEARAAAAAPLDTLGWRPDAERVSLRWILTHMIEEYARHNGHADLLRQCIDGAVGD